MVTEPQRRSAWLISSIAAWSDPRTAAVVSPTGSPAHSAASRRRADTAYRWMPWFMTLRITYVLGTVRFSSARAAVTHWRSPDSSRSFSDTGFDGGEKLAAASIGEPRRTSPSMSRAVAEYRATASGRSTSLSGPTLIACEAAIWMMPNTWARTGAVAESRDSNPASTS